HVKMEVKMQIIKVNTSLVERQEIETIVDVLRKEGVIVFPTETFYGLGADCFSKKASKRIFRLKSRGFSKPLPVVISDLNMLQDIVTEIPDNFHVLASRFWPGPLTLVLKASKQAPKEVLSVNGCIGVRLPGQPWLRELIRQFASPLTATSANISGRAEISNPEDVLKTFFGKIDLFVNGGPTQGVFPSTVVDLTLGRPKILREGAVPKSELKEYLELRSEL
ncbi:unnamed protein product, partial [marine sediment metagenome]